MKLVSTIHEMREIRRDSTLNSQTVGYVSTLGNLHRGHIALVEKAISECDISVASIFLNPSHFAEGEDYDKYPRTLREDCEKLELAKCDIAFIPSIEVMYPLGLQAQAQVTVPELSEIHCGASRPHFFGAVATIVAKSLNIVQPDVAYFGEKDFQQLAVIRRMVETLNFPTRIEAVPTVRESDGLAMSSRNGYLDAESRGRAVNVYAVLCHAKDKLERGKSIIDVQIEARAELEAAGFTVDYLNFVDAQTLGELKQEDKRMVILAAAWLDGVRLIDNVEAFRSV